MNIHTAFTALCFLLFPSTLSIPICFLWYRMAAIPEFLASTSCTQTGACICSLIQLGLYSVTQRCFYLLSTSLTLLLHLKWTNLQAFTALLTRTSYYSTNYRQQNPFLYTAL